ncbi:MAG: sulfotransferase [Alicyclobacillus sp.]|nr:sulfotransferase [Alicyclobacillus sp.]
MSSANAPLLLIGSQRSGTTALAYALSDAFAAVDSIFTVNGKLMYFLHRWLTNKDLYVRHFRADEILYSLKRRAPGGVGIERWLAQVEHVLRQAAAEVADGLHDDALALGRRIVTECYAGWSRWGDKYNEYLHHLSHLNELVPDARYILMFRTPYESAASVLEWTGDRPWRPSTVEGNLEKWAAWHTDVIQLLDSLAKDRYQVIEYYSLCVGKETRRLSDFVGLDLEPYLRNLKPRRKSTDHPPLPMNVQQVWNRLQVLHEA